MGSLLLYGGIFACSNSLSMNSGTPEPRQRKTHININKFAGLSRDKVGGKILFMCLFGHFLCGA